MATGQCTRGGRGIARPSGVRSPSALGWWFQVRRQLASRVEMTLRFSRCAGFPQHQRELKMRLRVIVSESQGFAELFDRPTVVACLGFSLTNADRERRRLGIGRLLGQPLGFGEGGFAGCTIAALNQCLAETTLRLD